DLARPWAEPEGHRAESARAERSAPAPGTTRPPAHAGTSPAPAPGLAPLFAPVLVVLVMSMLMMFVHLLLLPTLSSNSTVQAATCLRRHLDDISITVGWQALFPADPAVASSWGGAGRCSARA